MRRENGIVANFKMVDTCAAEFEARTPYYYSSYDDQNEAKQTANKKIMVLRISDQFVLGKELSLIIVVCMACGL